METMNLPKLSIKKADLCFSFLNSGDVYEITHQNKMINQIVTNPIDGSLNNIYLRMHNDGDIKAYPLLGIHSHSRLSYSDTEIVWEGIVEEIDYKVIFTLTEQGVWFWNVTVNGQGKDIDVIYGQDLGLADRGAVRNNEAYTAQYIDHSVYNDENKGYVVCSRQNQSQEGGFPYVQQGSLTKAIGYSTDGFQFFGLSYKETNQPETLSKATLANEVYQYEFAYIALQSKRAVLNGETQFVFYGLFKENHSQTVTKLEYENEILAAWASIQERKGGANRFVSQAIPSSEIGAPLQTLVMTKDEIEAYFPERHQEEWEGQTLLSFFTKTHEHIVLKQKELLVERPHGHILMSGQNVPVPEDVLTTTSFMYGIFNSTLSVGNTSFNKFLSNIRNPLNVMKTSGQRIYVALDGIFHQLTIPSMFEIGFNYVRWYYKTETELFVITNYTTVDSPEVHLHVCSASGKGYRFIVTNQVTMNAIEYEVPYQVKKEADGETLSYYTDQASLSGNTYPDLRFRLRVTGANWRLTDETVFVKNIEPNAASLSVLELDETSEWTVAIQGRLYGEARPFVERDVETEIESYRTFFKDVMNGFNLSHLEGTSDELEKVNDLAWWYTHNMLVHYSVPHGLEQYSGAAWGTRDVCQGPSEYFMVTQNYEVAANILKTVYSHQYEDTGNWPQWFMFDNYSKIQMDESHGDIIVWPLKVLSDYLFITNDFDILQEKLPYTQRGSYEFTEAKASLLEHVKKEINYIKEHFLHDTHLSSYGDGDWDDTLQPANPQLKKYMVSSWTVALTYQAINQLAKVLVNVDKEEADELQLLAVAIQSDFNHYIMSSDVAPGFVYMEDPKAPRFMLHPTDTETGIDYRLLPMNRGIISELFTPEQAETHYQIIKEYLACPDGVRLMNRPAQYTGGVSKHFKRAETASNFGREIGLQYVHAHIRFIEAMAKLGKVEEVWQGLEVINPVGLQKVVPNAERRQSNTYFSSSDGKFNTRYEAQDNFDQLRKGTVPVKGGWRIYSSGPGIYMNQLISHGLGIRQEAGELVIDPVLPEKLNGIKFEFNVNGRPITFIYKITGQTVKSVRINGHEADTIKLNNRYRQSGVRLPKLELEKNLKSDGNKIEIIM
jgi:1,2-beta-oligoglucan phosphorylase